MNTDNNQGKNENAEKLDTMRHSAAHVMAEAVQYMFPDAKFGIGPTIEDGFYYDFDLPRNLTPEDLPVIEAKMKETVKGNLPFTKEMVTKDQARQIFNNQPYKLELIGELQEEMVTVYRQGNFVDMCRGPHLKYTGSIKAFKLMTIAGAYWRGDEKRPMLQRIYAVAFNTQKELEEHLVKLEEAKKRDHRKLGKDLDIYVFDDEVGPGLPLWLPNGGAIIEEIEKLAVEMEFKRGYVRVKTPHVSKEDLFKHSGHLPYYADSMYPPMEMEGVKYYIKPMNCPMHHKIFSSRHRSYRDLPLRLAEYGTCYRYEKSGELFGLMRVRSMQMNDSHMYFPEKLFEQEFMGVIHLYLEYFKLFGITGYNMRFSTHSQDGLGKKYVNNERLWLKTEEMVRNVMSNNHIPYDEVSDEAAFYGPKIDVQVKSAIGREFTLTTNQVDFAQSERFGLVFTNENGKEEMPLIIHRAPLGTHERFIGFLLEHYAGTFPVWLAPTQVVVIPIADRHIEYANRIGSDLRQEMVRVKVDARPERMNLKIREAQLEKIPFMLVVGDKEMAESAVSVRLRTGEQLPSLSIEAFKAKIKQMINSRVGELMPQLDK